MNYSQWVTAVATILEYPIVNAASATPTGTDFDSMIPSAIDYAENRIQTDLDLLATIITDDTGTMTANSRLLNLPGSKTWIVTSAISPIVNGVRQSTLTPVTRDYMDFVFPSDASPGAGIVPVYWCPYDQAHVLVGPAPDQAYGFETVGTQRVTQMSSTNTSNFLSLTLPDLYVAASMVYLSGYQRQFGEQADDPKLAQSWESQYQIRKAAYDVEEVRKKFANMSPSPSRPTLKA